MLPTIAERELLQIILTNVALYLCRFGAELGSGLG